ncbi:hypothetical protein KUTeg_019525, partial [Tegillarca granosa]
MSNSGSSGSSSRGCCENGRPIMTDPHTGQTICSCQYSSTLLSYARVSGLPDGVYGNPAYAAATQGYVPLGSEGSAFYSPLANGAYDLKDTPDAWRSLTQPGACFPYDPSMAVYPYGAGYGGIDLNARRKNATRETTNTLKAWLYEHRKNPYPTKGEKIMLAIITKMTLTQVSTWFANARRRLKKENKMTWSPRNRSEDGTEDNDNDDDDLDDGKDPLSDNERLCDEKDDSSKQLHDGDDFKERIISVDDEDSNLSFKDLDDLDPFHPAPSVGGDSRSSDLASPSLNGSLKCTTGNSGTKDSHISSSNVQQTQNRPKIWSVSQFLNTPNNDSESEKSGSVITASKPKPFPNGGTSFLYLPSTNNAHALNAGRYGPFGAYPLSLTHTTLSYPYTLSSHTSAKAALASSSAMLNGPENLSTTGEKSVRSQNGLFSPARDIDIVRNG